MAGTLPIFKLEEAPELESPSPASARQSCLVRIYPASASGALTDLRGPRMTIGRDPLCDIELHDDFISRVHALFEEFGQNWLVTDRGSLNGTFVNDQRIEQHLLAPGDQVRLGNHIFKFLSSDHVEVQYHEAVYEMMTLDALTNTYNRRYFEDAFRREVLRAARHARPLALLLLDVDHFKQINDRYGHLVGDEVLRGLGLRLTGRTRGDELIARLGGEEFAIALPEVSQEDAARVADEYRRIVGDTPFETTRGAVRVTVSIGIAYACGSQELGSSQILEQADRKLYEAKHAGRNVVKW
jgi:diguanylate cyclase (GGDEF)-like protein